MTNKKCAKHTYSVTSIVCVEILHTMIRFWKKIMETQVVKCPTHQLLLAFKVFWDDERRRIWALWQRLTFYSITYDKSQHRVLAGSQTFELRYNNHSDLSTEKSYLGLGMYWPEWSC